MPAHKVNADLKLARKARTKTLSAATTLTVRDILAFDVVSGGNYAATLPAASAAMTGREVRFICTASSLTVVGIAASGAETMTLSEGDMGIIYCNGTYWYSLGPTTAA